MFVCRGVQRITRQHRWNAGRGMQTSSRQKEETFLDDLDLAMENYHSKFMPKDYRLFDTTFGLQEIKINHEFISLMI
jgi:hypothetical protein